MQEEEEIPQRYYRDEHGRRVITRAILFLGDPALFGTSEYSDVLIDGAHLYNVTPPVKKVQHYNKHKIAQNLKAAQSSELLKKAQNKTVQIKSTALKTTKPETPKSTTEVKDKSELLISALTKCQNETAVSCSKTQNSVSHVIDLTEDEPQEEQLKISAKTDTKTKQNESQDLQDQPQVLKDLQTQSQVLQHQTKDLKTQSQNQETNLLDLKNQSHSLQEQLQVPQSSSQNLYNLSKDLKNQLQDSSKLLQTSGSQSKVLDNHQGNLTSLNTKTHDLKNQSQSLLNQSEDLKNQSQSLGLLNQSEDLKTHSQDLQNQSEHLKNQSQDLKSEVQVLQNETKGLQDSQIPLHRLHNESQVLKSQSITTQFQPKNSQSNSKALLNQPKISISETKTEGIKLQEECTKQFQSPLLLEKDKSFQNQNIGQSGSTVKRLEMKPQAPSQSQVQTETKAQNNLTNSLTVAKTQNDELKTQSDVKTYNKTPQYENLYKSYIKEGSFEDNRRNADESFRNVGIQRSGTSKMDKNLIKGLAKPPEMGKAERMMQMMGWKGGALGKTGEGIIEPIAPNIHYINSSRGFGQETTDRCTETKFQIQKANRLSRAPRIPEINPQLGFLPKVTIFDSKRKPKGKKGSYKNMNTKKKKSAPDINQINMQIQQKNAIQRFKTNVFLHILEFVKDDTEIEIIFDPNLKRNERKNIHYYINVSLDKNTSEFELEYDLNVEQLEIVNEIHYFNPYNLKTESLGEEPHRALHVYKDPPTHIYLITPPDLREMDDEDDSLLEEAPQSPKKVKTTDNADSKENNDQIKIESNTERANEISNLLKEYLTEFVTENKYKELRFLGSFRFEETEKVNELLQFTYYSLQGMCFNNSYDDIFKKIGKSKFAFDVIYDNGSPIICKYEKGKVTQQQSDHDSDIIMLD